jgi:hypothetical protein
MIEAVLDEEKKRDEDEGGTRRKEGRGGRRDEEERGMRSIEGLGGRRDGEEGGTERQEGRGGRGDEESKKMHELLKKMKNEEVAKGRIIGLARPCYYRNIVDQTLTCIKLHSVSEAKQ